MDIYTPLFILIVIALCFILGRIEKSFFKAVLTALTNLIVLLFLDFFHPALLILLVIFFISHGLADHQRERKLVKWLLTLAALTPLIYYKLVPPDLSPEAKANLPLGFSFIFFSGISYIWWHRTNVSTKVNSWSFFASLSFFPTLIAGPFLKFDVLQEKIQQTQRATSLDFKVGALLICWGLAKKALGDSLAFAFPVSSLSSDLSPTQLILTVLAVPAQFYADFSGYADLAIGAARLMGLQIPANFHLPYFATSIAEFWRRWHISLGLWFRDFIFTPTTFKVVELCRKRHRWLLPHATEVGILITTVLIGIWHGITLKFLVWGLAMGIFIIFTQRVHLPKHWPAFLRNLLGWAGTFYIVIWAKLWFIIMSQQAWQISFQRFHQELLNFEISHSKTWIYLLIIITATLTPHLADLWMIRNNNGEKMNLAVWFLAVTLCLSFGFLYGISGVPFVYSKF